MDNGRNVLITGGTDGIGLLLVRHYLSASAAVVATGRRPVDETEFNTDNVHYIQADQARNDCSDNILQSVKQLGWNRIDNLILNAGTGTVGDPADESAEAICNTISVNLAAPITILQTLAPLLEASGRPGQVTLIGSTAIRGAAQFASYSASKAGLEGFARAVASEWTGRIKVQIIHPGPIATRMHEKAQLKVGFARRFFIHPDHATNRVAQIIERGTPRAFLSIGPREIVSGLLGRGPGQ